MIAAEVPLGNRLNALIIAQIPVSDSLTTCCAIRERTVGCSSVIYSALHFGCSLCFPDLRLYPFVVRRLTQAQLVEKHRATENRSFNGWLCKCPFNCVTRR